MAQSSILATLHHNGQIKTFYGTNAFIEASSAAADGDVITLSSGTFNAPVDTITKVITVRGTGMELDTLNNVEPTIINGNIVLNTPEASSSKLIFEALDLSDSIFYASTLKSPQFIKCRMDYVRARNNGRMINAQFLHCIISENIRLSVNSSATLVNSYVSYPYSVDSKTSNFEFQNCVLYMSRPGYIESSVIRNSIIVHTYGGVSYTSSGNKYYSLSPSTTAYNCVGVWTIQGGYTSSSSSYLFHFQTNTTNTGLKYANTSSANTSVFKNWDFHDDRLDNFANTRLELADSFKSKYLGSDGTEVGIYGGKLPFDPLSTNPRITKCEVDAKTTADGKLSVKVEVNGQK
jgi:hypothetical protein